MAAPTADVDSETFLFTSESVNEGHPDKLCDQVGRSSPGCCCTRVVQPNTNPASYQANCMACTPCTRQMPGKCACLCQREDSAQPLLMANTCGDRHSAAVMPDTSSTLQFPPVCSCLTFLCTP